MMFQVKGVFRELIRFSVHDHGTYVITFNRIFYTERDQFVNLTNLEGYIAGADPEFDYDQVPKWSE